MVPAGLFPENWISANPQFQQSNYWSNTGTSKYNSLQIQGTLRPTYGVTLQATYIFSKSMQTPLVSFAAGNGLTATQAYTNPVEGLKDYALSPNSVTHDFKSYGTFQLPIGPGRLLLANSHGMLARAVEGWQSSFVMNLSSGPSSTGQSAPISASYINASNGAASPTGQNGNSVPDIVGAFPRNGRVNWNGQFGSYFGSTFARVADPQCSAIAASLQSLCTLQAVTNASTGQIVLQNPRPGTHGIQVAPDPNGLHQRLQPSGAVDPYSQYQRNYAVRIDTV